MSLFKNTTRAEFAEFRAWCVLWVERFGLTDWCIAYRLDGESMGRLAGATLDAQARNATVYLANSHSADEPEWDMEALALHEVLHVVVADLGDLARSRYVMEDALERIEEALVVRLSHAIEAIQGD